MIVYRWNISYSDSKIELWTYLDRNNDFKIQKKITDIFLLGWIPKSVSLEHFFQEALARGWNGGKRYIDVWPVDLQKPVETGLGFDNSSLFLLQLACILSMSSRWRVHARLRVFICVNSLQVILLRYRKILYAMGSLRKKRIPIQIPFLNNNRITVYLQDMHRRERQLKNMLDTLRIKGESIVVPWDHVVCHFGPVNAAQPTQSR